MSTGRLSTSICMPPSTCICSPVAVTTVGWQFFAGLQFVAAFGEALDLVGTTDAGLAAQGQEEVAVGHRAQALVPGLVARLEMGVDVGVRPQPRTPPSSMRSRARGGACTAGRCTDPSSTRFQRQPYGQPRRQPAPAGDCPQTSREGRATIQVGERCSSVTWRRSWPSRQQRHRGGAAADDDHALAAAGPGPAARLRVDHAGRGSGSPPRTRGRWPAS